MPCKHPSWRSQLQPQAAEAMGHWNTGKDMSGLKVSGWKQSTNTERSQDWLLNWQAIESYYENVRIEDNSCQKGIWLVGIFLKITLEMKSKAKFWHLQKCATWACQLFSLGCSFQSIWSIRFIFQKDDLTTLKTMSTEGHVRQPNLGVSLCSWNVSPLSNFG